MSNELDAITHRPSWVSGSFDKFIRHSTLDIRHLTAEAREGFGHRPLRPWLRSVAAPRLNKDAAFARYSFPAQLKDAP
jgi:hypothetical protein